MAWYRADTGGRIKVDLTSLESLINGSISYQWFADGVEIPGATPELITTNYTDERMKLTCMCRSHTPSLMVLVKQ